VLYFRRLWNILVMAPTVPRARSFIYSILIAFLPAAVLGALFHDKIKQYLFESPTVIAIALVIVIVLLAVIPSLLDYPQGRDKDESDRPAPTPLKPDDRHDDHSVDLAA